MIYTLYFSEQGTPKTGLAPTIDIYIKVSDGTSAGTPPAVSELSGGFYKFTATPAEVIICRINSGSATAGDADKYKVLQITPNDDDLDAAVSTVKTKTDGLNFTGTYVNAQVKAQDNIDFGALQKASINVEVLDVIGTDTIAELAQGQPSATPTLLQAVMLLYMALRNSEDTTATQLSIKNDADTVICKATLSDDGTTFTKAKLATGP